MKTLTAGNATTDGLRAGKVMVFTIVTGSVLVERLAGGAVVEKRSITKSTSFGPYAEEMAFRVTCFTGSVKFEPGTSISPEVDTEPNRDYTVMLWCFPGWPKTKGGGPFPNDPWGAIPANRLPLIGIFDEAEQGPCDYILAVLRDHGIDVLNIECYFKDNGTGTLVPGLDHFLKCYMASMVPNKPKFCLTFICDTYRDDFNAGNWPQVYNWAFPYFRDPNYFRVDGKPLFGILGIPSWQTIMGSAAGAAAALNQARAAAQPEFGGIHFLGAHADTANFWKGTAVAHGWDAITSYTVFNKTENNGDSVATSKDGFARLDDAVFGDEEVINAKTYHSWMGNAGYSNPPAYPAPTLSQNGWPSTSIPHVITPIMTGWDSRPWDGSNTLFAIPTDAEFEAHLIKARNVTDTYRAKTRGFVCICALNEFGEGQYIFPTVGKGFGPLQAIKRVFG